MKKSETKTPSTKTLKSQLVALTAMLLVAAISLGTATYAWFVSSQVTKVDTMQFQATTSTSLQVAVVTTSSGVTAYKGNVTNDDITTSGGWAAMFTDKLNPATADNANVLTDTFYKSNGNMNDVQKLNEFVAATVGTGDVKKIPLSFLASKDMNVYFGEIGSTLTSDSLLSIGTASGATQKQLDLVKTSLRIAVTDGTNATIFQFKDDNLVVTGASNNTDYNSVDISALTQNDSTGKYIAVKSADGTTKKVATVGQQSCVPTTDFSDYAATVTSATSVTAGTTPLFSLTANTAKQVNVYIWIEGTDPGCLSVLSEYNFGVNLPFAGASIA